VDIRLGRHEKMDRLGLATVREGLKNAEKRD
jgi:hypothetical protein